MTEFIFCGCEHSFQDNQYGEHVRIGNKLAQKSVYRCTSCGNTTSKTV